MRSRARTLMALTFIEQCRLASQQTFAYHCRMKILSWNINVLRSALDKGFDKIPASGIFDVICRQETCISAPMAFDGYHVHWSFAQRKGYSGVAILSKEEPLSFTEGIGHELDAEERVLTAEFPAFYLMSVYSPTVQEDCRRLPLRMK